MTKNDHLKRQHFKRKHFLKCDQALFEALKTQKDIAPLLSDLVAAGRNVPGIDLQERLHSGIEVALRCNQKSVAAFLPYLKGFLPPIILLTAVYSDKLHLVEYIIPHSEPNELHALSFIVASARNNVDILMAILPLAGNTNFLKVLENAVWNTNERMFEIVYPFVGDQHFGCIKDEHSRWGQWTDRLAWMDAQMQRCALNAELNCNPVPHKTRKM